MALSEDRLRALADRLLRSRVRLVCGHGFYGLLLMHMRLSVSPDLATAATDGARIIFGADFLDSLSDSELDFVMLHEILHVALQHCFRGQRRDQEAFNIACDIVVNSLILQENAMDLRAITLKRHGEAMHLAPDGKEGFEYTAEEVYAMLPRTRDKAASGADGSGEPSRWDDHSIWGQGGDDSLMRDIWAKRLQDACQAISIRDPNNSRGLLPLFAQRMFTQMREPQTYWRAMLASFVQEEICDFTFSPPDRRFDGGDFFLPDFSDKDQSVRDILFMIDSSGSVSDDMMTAAYSEVKGALDQFGGKLSGWLGFFDSAVAPPKPFCDEAQLREIKPAGGGGTSFKPIFKYVAQEMQDQPPAAIVILTDGAAPFPPEREAMGVPVLWLINNDRVTPPWGKVARIRI